MEHRLGPFGRANQASSHCIGGQNLSLAPLPPCLQWVTPFLESSLRCGSRIPGGSSPGARHSQKKMTTHQAAGMHLPLRFAASLALRRKELLGVFVALEDILALVPTVQDAIYASRILNEELARHGRLLPIRPGSVNNESWVTLIRPFHGRLLPLSQRRPSNTVPMPISAPVPGSGTLDRSVRLSSDQAMVGISTRTRSENPGSME